MNLREQKRILNNCVRDLEQLAIDLGQEMDHLSRLDAARIRGVIETLKKTAVWRLEVTEVQPDPPQRVHLNPEFAQLVAGWEAEINEGDLLARRIERAREWIKAHRDEDRQRENDVWARMVAALSAQNPRDRR